MSRNKLQKQLMGASAMVMEMAVLTMLGAFAGSWLDGHANTSPLLLLAGLAAGLVAGMARLLSTLDRLNKDDPPSSDHHP